ncbi:MAG: replication-associated recombination protein A [Eubacteriales bacterium]
MSSPLADRIRPKTLDDVVGQQHLFGKNALLAKALAGGKIPNMIFYGPSGTGKTTVANIIAAGAGMTFRKINATNGSLADIKQVLDETGSMFGTEGILLYIDEIQYFNKKQQQSLLEFIEDGRITLIGSTTDNPYFSVYPAVLSRCSVFEFKSVPASEIKRALVRAYRLLAAPETADAAPTSVTDAVFELPVPENVDQTLAFIASAACGDVRRAMGALELCFGAAGNAMTPEFAAQGITAYGLKMDKDGDEHYDLLSAFQKSIRGSDENAAIFYLAKMLEAGDLLSPIRRLLVIASEDIGLAYPMAAAVVKACCDNAVQLGLPEARLPLAQAVIFLATLPKSNSAYNAYSAAAKDIHAGLGMNMPDYIRDSMQIAADKNRAYVYPHTFPNHYYAQQYLPDDIKDRVYYEYGDNKVEKAAKEYWEKIKK